MILAAAGLFIPFFASAQSLSIDDVAIGETAGTASFTVMLSPPSDQIVRVDVATSDGTAVAGADYVALPATTLTFPPGETSLTVDVSILDDALFEGDETFSLLLSNPVDAVILDDTGTGTIVDDEGPPVVDLITTGETVAEDGGSVTVTVQLSAVAGLDVTVPFTVSGSASAGADFTLSDGPLVIPAGSVTATATITLVNDTLDEDDETVEIGLEPPVNAVLGTVTRYTLTITDDDPLPGIAISDATVSEATGTAGFVVQLTAPSGRAVTVDVSTSDVTATAGSDYLALGPETLVFPPGATVQIVDVAILDDTLSEPLESFSVVLAGPVNTTLIGGPATGTILDDDAPPVLTIGDVSVSEGSGIASFPVALSAPSGFAISVQIATSDLTATGGADYVPLLPATMSFAPGQTSGTFDVVLIDDFLNEPPETFALDVTNPEHVTILGDHALGTILDDDPAPAISIGDVTVSEGGGTALFPVTLSAPTAFTVTVGYATSDLTATAGSDYLPAGPGTLTFVPGQTSRTIPVIILDDTALEFAEQFAVTLSGPTNAAIDRATGIATITDNDSFHPEDFGRYADVSLESGGVVGQFYSVGVNVDTAALIASGFLNPDASDLAVAWDETGTGQWMEIDAHLRPATNQTLATSTVTQVWFALHEPTGVAAYPYTGRYRIYYRKPSAVLADRRRNGGLVYRFFDGFDRNVVDTSLWYVHPSYRPAVTESGGALHMNGALSPGAVWQGAPIRMTSQTAANVPTFSTSYASAFAGECRFRSLNLGDDVRPVNYFQHLPPPGFPNDHDEYTSFIHNNGAQSFRLVKVSNGVGTALAFNPTVILPNVWYDYKVTARLVDPTPGLERALHAMYLDDVELGDSAAAARGGYDATITSGVVGIETDPGTAGDYDWFLMRDFVPDEPLQSLDPYVSLQVRQTPGGTEVTWQDPGGAVSWDVIRGRLDWITVTPTGVDLGPVSCLEDNSPDTTTAPDHLDPTDPPDGEAFFYLLRTNTSLGPGTYGHASNGARNYVGSGDCF